MQAIAVASSFLMYISFGQPNLTLFSASLRLCASAVNGPPKAGPEAGT